MCLQNDDFVLVVAHEMIYVLWIDELCLFQET